MTGGTKRLAKTATRERNTTNRPRLLADTALNRLDRAELAHEYEKLRDYVLTSDATRNATTTSKKRLVGARHGRTLPVDPAVARLTEEQIHLDIAEYVRLLDGRATEQDVHCFLSSHSYFFNQLIRLFSVSPLYSKIRLGSDHEMDFVCFDGGSTGPEWHLIEIEGPSEPLFTRSGDPSARLAHAIRQVQDWQSWIYRNYSTATTLMPHIEMPMGHVIMGRRRNLTLETMQRLKRMNYGQRAIEIRTLDSFVERAKTVVPLLGHPHRWQLPMHALTHRDLAAGLPPAARRYMQQFFRGVRSMVRYPEEFLRDREYEKETAFNSERDVDEP